MPVILRGRRARAEQADPRVGQQQDLEPPFVTHSGDGRGLIVVSSQEGDEERDHADDEADKPEDADCEEDGGVAGDALKVAPNAEEVLVDLLEQVCLLVQEIKMVLLRLLPGVTSHRSQPFASRPRSRWAAVANRPTRGQGR